MMAMVAMVAMVATTGAVRLFSAPRSVSLAGAPDPAGWPPALRLRSGVVTGAPRAQVTLAAGARVIPIPASFLGISTEYWSVPMWSRRLPLLHRVLSLVGGDGPVQLRIGGDSADRSFWSPARRRGWMFAITPSWLRSVARVVRYGGVRLILDLNLVTATPAQAFRWAQIALARLPRHSISGFEIGNEPDIYSLRTWRAATAGGMGSRSLPAQITPAQYAVTFRTEAGLLRRVTPAVGLLGPALAEPQVDSAWIRRLLATSRPGIGAVTVHRYPYSACAAHRAPTYPTIRRVLSERAAAGVARSITPAVRLSRRAGVPLRVTELNSVTCGGVSGVSNTFATALWAADALFELIRAGASSVDVHVRAHAINAAFTLTRRGLAAHPLLYGMILFAQTLGAHPELLSLRLHTAREHRLKAWAVRTSGGKLRLLLINKTGRSMPISLKLPSAAPVAVMRLLAPSVSARSGITLGGRWLDASGRWQGRRTVQILPADPAGRYVVTLGPMSAALLTTHAAMRYR